MVADCITDSIIAKPEENSICEGSKDGPPFDKVLPQKRKKKGERKRPAAGVRGHPRYFKPGIWLCHPSRPLGNTPVHFSPGLPLLVDVSEAGHAQSCLLLVQNLDPPEH